jgi:hypothetical protein
MHQRRLLSLLLIFAVATAGVVLADNFNCDGQQGLIADPDDCQSFYFCTQGHPPQHETCDDGLLFSQEINNCDYAENVDCNERPNPNSPTGQPEPTTEATDPETTTESAGDGTTTESDGDGTTGKWEGTTTTSTTTTSPVSGMPHIQRYPEKG